MDDKPAEPAFFLIGAQKAGTTWLWAMLDQHPETSLPAQKEIHYFGSSELYARGEQWYLSHFEGLDAGKLIGEASTTYFYDRVPYWYNDSDELAFDDAMPSIPRLINDRFPEAKFIVVLRDPVRRAISAYFHWMRRGELSPKAGLEKLARRFPKTRILEYGYYADYLQLWRDVVGAERLRVVIFEDQIRQRPEESMTELYRYLGIDADFKATAPARAVHKSWGWTRILFNYYAGKFYPQAGHTRIGRLCDRFDVLGDRAIRRRDVEFLREVYLPLKSQLVELLGRPLDCWDYGGRLLETVKP